jgi:hypothetical protein
MAPKTEIPWQEINDNEENEFSTRANRLHSMVSRAVLVYLGLFLGLSIFISMLGINPLIHNGALPICLLAYVGSALILALANDETSLVEEQARSWLILAYRQSFQEHLQKREPKSK